VIINLLISNYRHRQYIVSLCCTSQIVLPTNWLFWTCHSRIFLPILDVIYMIMSVSVALYMMMFSLSVYLSAFHLRHNQYVRAIDVQHHHHNTQVLHNLVISRPVSEPHHCRSVVRNGSRVHRTPAWLGVRQRTTNASLFAQDCCSLKQFLVLLLMCF